MLVLRQRFTSSTLCRRRSNLWTNWTDQPELEQDLHLKFTCQGPNMFIGMNIEICTSIIKILYWKRLFETDIDLISSFCYISILKYLLSLSIFVEYNSRRFEGMKTVEKSSLFIAFQHFKFFSVRWEKEEKNDEKLPLTKIFTQPT